MRKGIEKTYLILHGCMATFPAMQYQICLFCTFSHLRNFKGHCHGIWQLYKKLKGVFASIEFQNLWSSYVIKDYLKVLKLFLFACRYGWHGWKWIETWKNWPIFSSFDATCYKNREKMYYGEPTLIRFIWYLPRSFTEAFCLWLKPESNDFSTELT